MASGCPINNLIPEWNDLVYRGLWREALDRLHKTNNFPEFTGRVCPAPCEGSCVLGINEPAGHDQEHRGRDHRPGLRGGLGRRRAAARCAPARRSRSSARARPGLAARGAAEPGRPHGHRLRARRPHRRPADVRHPEHEARQAHRRAARRSCWPRKASSSSPTPTSARTTRPSSCASDFDAIVLVRRRDPAARPAGRGPQARGRPLRHGVPDRQHARACSTATSPTASTSRAKGKDVIVIGGGDTGTDCVGTSLRHGCKSLVQFEILPRPPTERAADNPWPQWPQRLQARLRPGGGRGAVRRRPARLPDGRPSASSATQHGNVKELHTVEVEWVKNGDGRARR